ncbi:MAG: calcium/sodium antiporter [Candidatus Kuenenbacteria bacterium]
MWLSYFLFIAGFVILIKGAGWLVDGASSVAKKFGISTLVIGLTVVSFGTSAPELIVNILASIKGSSDIAIGNILGSNIANILLILGVAAAIFPLTVKRGTVWKEIPLALLAVIVVALMANDILIEGSGWSGLTRIDGFMLLAFFLIFLYYAFETSKVSGSSGETKIKIHPLPASLGMIVGGLIGLTLGGKWVVDGAVAIAQTFNISEALIGLTIVAIGTSLPELATSAIAAYKRNADIAVGNVVGSNIFNMFWILGLSATIRPLPFSAALNTDVLVTMVATILLFMVMFIGKKHTLERWQGFLFVTLYFIYIAYLIYRG